MSDAPPVQPGDQPVPATSDTAAGHADFTSFESPFIRAPESVRTIFLVTFVAAACPLAAGLVIFGWRAGVTAALSILTCAVVENAYYRVTRAPALLGRTHAYLTGLLLALTLPPAPPWYVPVVGAAFAILVGKAIFGGVGHFLWQPALVGRLVVGVMFASTLSAQTLPILAPEKALWGDVREAKPVPKLDNWRTSAAPDGADAMLVRPVWMTLGKLTRGDEPAFSGLAYPPDAAAVPQAKPTLLAALPSMSDMFAGTRPGGIGETSAIVIIVAGLYLIYRDFVKWQLPVFMILSAAAVAAVAPIRLAGVPGQPHVLWWPLLTEEGLDVGFIYVCYQLLAGPLLLAAFMLATEMTSRPVTKGGQVVFAVGCGATAMMLQLYMDSPIPVYLAVVAMNTFTPVIDSLWRPRVMGMRRFAWLRGP